MLKYTSIQPYCAPNFKDQFVCEFWYEQLGTYGTERLSFAFKKLVCRNKFPSIDEVRKECGDDEVSDDTIARDVAERIHHAIGRFGGRNYDRALEYIGEIGEQTIGGSSGWIAACDGCTNSNSGIYKAQWRERAKGILDLARKGISGPPKLPSVNTNIKSLPSASTNLAVIKNG